MAFISFFTRINKLYASISNGSGWELEEVLMIDPSALSIDECIDTVEASRESCQVFLSVAVVVPLAWVDVSGDDNGGGQQLTVSSLDFELDRVSVE